MNNIQYKFKYIMAFKYRQKKTLRRKRRFLKRKSAKTYRRSRKGVMRGGNETWKVQVNYAEYTSDQTLVDNGAVVEKVGDGTFELIFMMDEGYSGILILNGDIPTNLRVWNKATENQTKFITNEPVYIRKDPKSSFLGSLLKTGDKQIISFEKTE